MNQAKASIIIPTYNMAPTLERAVNSVMEQTHENIELVIVNDGSTDNTPEVIDSLVKSNPESNIVVKTKNNGGRSSAINEGLEILSGKYTALLDADDTLPKESVSKRVDFLETNPDFKVVLGDAVNMTREGTAYCKRGKPSYNSSEDLYNQALTGVLVPFNHIRLMWNSDLAKEIGGFDSSSSFNRVEDVEFMLRLLKNVEVGYTPDMVYEYRLDYHNLKFRVKNRIIGAMGKLKLINREVSGLEKIPLMAKKAIIETAKLLYDSVSQNPVYSMKDIFTDNAIRDLK